MAVVPLGMSADELFVARLCDGAVAGDVVVVAGEAEAVAVVADELQERVAAVLARRTTMNDNQIYSSHSVMRDLASRRSEAPMHA